MRMARTNLIDNTLNVYKPAGISSYDVVRKVKRVLGIKKVGHGGTLDPFGEGVLLILIGKATKRMPELLKLPKSYEALLHLGEATASGDYTNPIIRTAAIPEITAEMLAMVARLFTGTRQQRPPAFSAKKINGRPAYRLARKGVAVELQPKEITIYDLKLEMSDTETILIKVTCSSGTYIRTLGEDIAKALGTEGHLKTLKRTRIGDYRWENAIQFAELEQLTPEIEGSKA